jgi:hypothetical protein
MAPRSALALLAVLATASASSKAQCRVASSSWGDNDKEEQTRSGYGYKFNQTYVVSPIDEGTYPGGARAIGDEAMGCSELRAYPAEQVNRSFLLHASAPLLILGATDGSWGDWSAEQLLARHASDVFAVGRSGDKTVGEVLQDAGRYHTGQVNLLHDCYHDGVSWPDCGEGEGQMPDCEHVAPFLQRQFSPFLASKMRHGMEAAMPAYLKPLRALQLALSNGTATGVRTEEHPSAWWANLEGRKRWLFHPPTEANPGKPSDLLLKRGRASCAARFRLTSTVACDQPEGSVMWVPPGWHHETCSLDSFSAGVGALSFDGADMPPPQGHTHECPRGAQGDEYRLDETTYCQSAECAPLPYAAVAAMSLGIGAKVRVDGLEATVQMETSTQLLIRMEGKGSEMWVPRSRALRVEGGNAKGIDSAASSG